MEKPPVSNADYIVPAKIDIDPHVLAGKLTGSVKIGIGIPDNAAALAGSSVRLAVNGKDVAAEIKKDAKGYQVKADRRAFVQALAGQTGEVEAKIAIVSDTGSAFVGTDTVIVKTESLTLSVRGDDSVKAGEEFSLSYAVNGAGDSMRELNLNLSYDPEVLEFVAAESAVKQLNFSAEAGQPGRVTVKASGTSNQLFNKETLFTVRMKAKETEAARSEVAARDIVYANAKKERHAIADAVHAINLFFEAREIAVSGEGGASAIDSNRGTLRLSAQVKPANANQSVTWSVYGLDGEATELASITPDGLLSGNSKGLNGQVKVIATATDGSGVTGELTVDISNQLQALTGSLFGAEPAWAAGSEYDKAFDGDVNTYYDFKNGAGGYAGMDLGEGAEARLDQVRFYPRKGMEVRMVGGKFQGSNVSSTEGFVDLHTIGEQPAAGWNTVNVSADTAYRYIRYYTPETGNANVAELEFYAAPAASDLMPE
ncbi:cohesin domain-containing protein [Saccharibacillus alkalitolerans]|nr:cohesin domain-containing protein [Saccharibacillus alkalitolerans]